MGEVVDFQGDHAASRGLRNESIGTAPPETSLKRRARRKDASLRPAIKLRKCASEQPAALAKALRGISLALAQIAMGCSLDISPIPTGNDESQEKKFLVEISKSATDTIQSVMAKKKASEPREIYLGDWLEHFGIGPTEAACIAGCSQPYISNIKGGRKANVNAIYLLRLSEHMGVNVNDFFRPLPPAAHLENFRRLSPKAQTAILKRKA